MPFTNQFLNQYTKFEDFIRKRNNGNNTFDIFHDSELKTNIQKWYPYRVLRNLLTHNNNMRNGQYINVTEKLYTDFVKDTEIIMSPPNVMSICIPFDKIFTADPSSLLSNIIDKMLNKNYTSTPILNSNNQIIGVISAHSLMMYFNKNNKEIIIEPFKMNISDILEFCKLNNNPNIEYRFISKTQTVESIKQIFKDSFLLNKRIEAMFITENGNENEKLLGLVTYWDLNKAD